MENVTFRNSKGKELVGNIHEPSTVSGKGVIITHGFASSKDRQRRVELADALCREGYGVLRFNFGGSEGSYKTDLRPSYQVDDLESAIKYMQSRGYTDLGLASESLGANISTMINPNGVKSMVLYAPLLVNRAYNGEKLEGKVEGGIKLGENGKFVKDGIEFRIGSEYMKERAQYKPETYLPRIGCPVLILHGDQDDLVRYNVSEKAMTHLNEQSELRKVHGAGHVLEADQIVDPTIEWFKQYL
jgi:pimeloyl-ACP methyl ester carboxylesterase